jgi:hypothetical protein
VIRRAMAGVALAASVAALVGIGSCTHEKGGSTQELCSVVSAGSFGALFQQGFDPTNTTQALAQLKAASADLAQLRSAAPTELRGAIEDEVAYVDAATKVLQTVSPDDEAAVVAGINGLSTQRAAAQAGSTKLKAYQAAHCGSTPSSG